MLPIKVIRSTPAAGINNSIHSCIRGNTSLLKSNIFTSRNSSCVKVMFSQPSVCSGGGGVGGIGISHASWTYPTLFWTYPTPGIPCPLLLTSGGHLWTSVQTCSLKALSPPNGTDIYRWLLKQAVSILLECFLVVSLCVPTFPFTIRNKNMYPASSFFY